jgi:hypothetical protein
MLGGVNSKLKWTIPTKIVNKPIIVIPAKAGIQFRRRRIELKENAGLSGLEVKRSADEGHPKYQPYTSDDSRFIVFRV